MPIFGEGALATILTVVNNIFALLGLVRTELTFEHQQDSVTIVANPVSGTPYSWRQGLTGAGAELGNRSNVRIISVTLLCTFTVQPGPLEAHLTMDGYLVTHTIAAPATATPYEITIFPNLAPTAQGFVAIDTGARYRSFMYEGRDVEIEAEITGGTVQNLTMKVKWAQR